MAANKKHDHSHHHCDCKHERLRFCAKCCVPHCLDCGMEWVTKPAHSGYWYYGTPYYLSSGTGITNGSSTITTGNVSPTTNTVTLDSFNGFSATCNHDN